MFLNASNISTKHGFFGREGGVSDGIYASLNCGPGSNDAPETVQQNRKIVIDNIGAESLVTAHQTHSEIAVIVNGPMDHLPQADALVTSQPGVALGILTADCAPILLQDNDKGVIGAAHAGWRGARFGIIGSVIRAMENIGAVDISAAIGPCISQDSYEVSKDFFEVFASEYAENNEFFKPAEKEGHLMFDLQDYVKMKLEKHGIKDISVIDEDTLSQPEKFFSYRASQKNGHEDYGRQISVICL